MTEEISQRELAARLGLTTRQVRNLHDHGLERIMRAGKPLYRWPEALHWYIGFKIREAGHRGGGPSYEEARAREMLARAEMAELDLAERRGQLVTVDYMAAQLEACLSALRGKLLNLPGTLAPRVIGCGTIAKAHEVIQDEIDELMRALSAAGADEDLDEMDDLDDEDGEAEDRGEDAEAEDE